MYDVEDMKFETRKAFNEGWNAVLDLARVCDCYYCAQNPLDKYIKR